MWVLDLGESPSGKFPAEISSYVLDFSEKYLDQRRVKGKGQLALTGTKTNNTVKQQPVKQQRRYGHCKVKEKEFRNNNNKVEQKWSPKQLLLKFYQRLAGFKEQAGQRENSVSKS